MRTYYPYWEWEDLGMWRNVRAAERDQFLTRAIAFTGDAAAYGAAMLQVLDAFPIACEQNLMDFGQNRQAWIGHAAVFLAFECPEDITREAWGHLTQQQRDEANAVADIAIARWEYEKKNTGIHLQMDLPGIPGWHPGRSAIAA